VSVERLRPEDHEEALDFLNLVFGGSAPEGDFERMLPLCYRPRDIPCNVAVREDGRIRAIVGLFERDWLVAGRQLRLGCIGGVSTHPRVRGRGHMRGLMDHCLRQMADEGVDASWLGGQRQRYLRFGYERCGVRVRMSVDPDNVARAGVPSGGLVFEPLAADHDDRLDAVWALHDRQPIRHPRSRESLHGYLVAWHSEPWVALDAGGAVVGYLVADARSGAVSELVAPDDLALQMVCAWVTRQGRRADLVLSPAAAGAVHRIGAVCATATLAASGNWRVFRWVPVLSALLTARASLGPVVAGEVRIGIDGDRGLCLACDGVAFDVTACPVAAADLHLDAPTAMRTLFGPLRPSQVQALPQAAAVLDQWCPLPAYWAVQDGV
jgi:ribosomal protein S18 acetylase RimI-like enzyme